MKVKDMWKKTLAGCLSLTLALSGGMAAFSMEEAAEEPSAAAAEEIRDADVETIEEEILTVEEDISEEETASAEVPALEAAQAQDAADEEAAVDGLIEDLDTLAAAEDEPEEVITVTLIGGDDSRSCLLDENYEPVINEYGDRVFDGPSSIETSARRDSYFYLYDFTRSFQREGYKLTGWTDESGDHYYEDDSVYISEDATEMVLTAEWEPTVTVTLDAGEGSTFNKKYLDDDHYRSNSGTNCRWDADGDSEVYLRDDLFAKTGSAVDYWYDADDNHYGADEWHEFTEPTVLYAHWITENIVTVTLDLGEGHVFTFYKRPGSYLDLEMDFDYEPEGKALIGWERLDAEGNPTDEAYNADDTLDITEDDAAGVISLRAKWVDLITVTWHWNRDFYDGSEEYMYTEELPEGQLIHNIPGHSVSDEEGEWVTNGFYVNERSGQLHHQDEVTAADGMHLYLNWTAPVILTLKANGGYWNNDASNKTDVEISVDPNRTMQGDELPGPDYPGKILVGWTFPDGTSAFEYDEDGNSNSVQFYESTVLTAKWEDAAVITFVGNGGTTERYNYDTEQDEKVGRYTESFKKGSSIELDRGYFEREGYLITGWKIGNTTYNDPWYSFTASGNVTVTAVWAKKVTVTFDVMGGHYQGDDEGEPLEPWSEDYAAGERIWYSSYAKEGYVQTGWNTTKAGALAGIAVYPRYPNLTAAQNMSLYAVWKEAYTITLDGNGGTYYKSYREQNVPIQEIAVEKGKAPQGIGYAEFYKTEGEQRMYLSYWSTTDPETEEPVMFDWSKPLEADITLYAVWEKGADITLDLNGGRYGERSDYNEVARENWTIARFNWYYSDVTPPAGKSFGGWTTEKDNLATLLPDYPPFYEGTGNTTLYAYWIPAVGTKLTGPDGASYTVGSYGTVTYNAPKKKTSVKSVNVPDTVKIGGYTYEVTAIAANAFSGAKKLKTVTIGSNIRTIGAKAFYKTPQLKKVTIKGVWLTSIGSKAFQKAGSKSYKKLKIYVPKARKAAYTTMLKKAKLNKKCKIK